MTRCFAISTSIFVSALTLASATWAETPQSGNPPITVTANPAKVERVTDKLPIEAFAELDLVEQATLSPNGKYLAGIFGIGGVQSIAIIALEGPNIKIPQVHAPDLTQVDELVWANDDNVIIRLRKLDEIFGEKGYFGRAHVLSRITGKAMPLLDQFQGGDTSTILWAPGYRAGNEVLMAASKGFRSREEATVAIYSVDVTNNHYHQVLAGFDNINNWQADSAGVIRLGEGHDDFHQKDIVTYHGHGATGFRLLTTYNEKTRNNIPEPFSIFPDSDHALVSDPLDNGLSAIAEYDLASMSKLTTLYTPNYHESSPILDEAGTKLLGVRDVISNDRLWFDPELTQLQKNFNASVPGAKVNIIDWSHDRSMYLVHIGDADMPGAYYYFKPSEGALHKIGNVNKVIGFKHLAEVKMIKYLARDGLEIEAKLTLPTVAVQKNLPIIMLPHGGPWGHDNMRYDYWSQFLANRGYVVIQPNFRVSTGYGSKFSKKGDGALGKAMQDDVTDGLNWAVKEGLADPKRACILGASYGGYAAMWGVIKDPNLYRCSVSIAGVAALERQINATRGSDIENSNDAAWHRIAPDTAAVSPINFVDKITVPMLLIHGKQDITVDVSQSREMYSKMKSAGKTVEYVELPLADHHYQRQADRVTLLTAIDTFLAKYNPADGATPAKP